MARRNPSRAERRADSRGSAPRPEGGGWEPFRAATRIRDWPPFRRLIQAQLAHGAGDAIVAVALADTLFFSVPLGEARDRVGLYLVLTMAPFALLSPVVGPLLDRRDGAYRLGITLAASGRTVLAILLSTRTDRLELYPLAFGLLVLSRVHGVSRGALVPDAAPVDRSLMWSNAWLAVISVVGGVAGAAVGVALTKWGGADGALRVAAAVFALGAVASFRLPRDKAGGRRREPVPDFRALLSPRLVAGGVAMAGSRGAVGFITFLLPFLLRGAGENGRDFAVVVAAAALGGFVGSAFAPILRRVLRESSLLLVTLLGMALSGWWAAASFDVPKAALVAAAVGFGSGAGRLAFDSLLQHEAPEVIRGRTFARYETIFQLCWVAGAGIATVVHFSSAGGLRTLAGICLVTAALSLRGLRRPADDGAAL